MHGAAIAHGVLMRPGSISLELKTQYGYESILFALVSDARRGIHGQVDIRKYFVPGGHKPVDGPLIARTLHVLEEALRYQQVAAADLRAPAATKKNSTLLKSLDDSVVSVSTQFRGDLLVGPSASSEPTVHHVLGPFQSNQTQICQDMLFARLRRQLEVKGSDSFHCAICTTYVVRR